MRELWWPVNWASVTKFAWILTSLTLLLLFGRLVLEVFGDAPTVAESYKAQSESLMAEVEKARPKGTALQLVLDPSCVPCEKSFPFYRALVETKVSKGFFVEALVQIPPAMALNYLERQELRVDSARQINFRDAGFIGTPTIRVLDEQGNVLQSWIGKLSAAQEKEVAFLLGAQTEFLAITRRESLQESFGGLRQSLSVSVSAEEVGAILRGDPAVVVLDVRPRSQYANSHVRGAKNIPQDEVSVRATNELDAASQILVHCLSNGVCSINELMGGTSSVCLQTVLQLQEAGFTKARLIAASLGELNAANAVTVDSSNRIYLPRIVLTENLW